ncbi:MAG: hypothetical protein ABR929_13285 [Roseiarcus sp.]
MREIAAIPGNADAPPAGKIDEDPVAAPPPGAPRAFRDANEESVRGTGLLAQRRADRRAQIGRLAWRAFRNRAHRFAAPWRFVPAP